MKSALVIGSSGFIGSSLVSRLQSDGYYVVGSDIEFPKYSKPNHFVLWDWRRQTDHFYAADRGVYDRIYVLGCLMGGMGYIGDEEKHGYDITVGSTEIVMNAIRVAKAKHSSAKIFYSSSACVYNQELQKDSGSKALKESDAIPSSPDLLYGWQKLYSEFCFMASGLDVRIARFHNIFGKWGTWDGGKEKAPAALMRKVASAKNGDSIEVWGTGEQARSFLHIDECLEGVEVLMQSDYKKPINIGSDELVTINQLAKMVIDVSGKDISIKNVEGNVGVHSRNSDNTLIQKELGWRPTKPLVEGIIETYPWIKDQVENQW